MSDNLFTTQKIDEGSFGKPGDELFYYFGSTRDYDVRSSKILSVFEDKSDGYELYKMENGDTINSVSYDIFTDKSEAVKSAAQDCESDLICSEEYKKKLEEEIIPRLKIQLKTLKK